MRVSAVLGCQLQVTALSCVHDTFVSLSHNGDDKINHISYDLKHIHCF